MSDWCGMGLAMALNRATLEAYAAEIRRIRSDPGHNPETSLYGPLEVLLREAAADFRPSAQVIAQHNTRQKGVPDFALLDAYGHPFAYVEAKSPAKQLDALTEPERQQQKRYRELPCVLYTNFSEVLLYENGEAVGSARLLDSATLLPSPRPPQVGAFSEARDLLERMFAFAPSAPRSPKEVADVLARRARLIRDVVLDVLGDPGDNPLREVHQEFSDVLFAELTADRFADAYAQTLTYGLLLARLLRPQAELTLSTAPDALGADHRLLSAALRLLGYPEVIDLIGWSVQALLTTANLVDPGVLSRGGQADPTIYFYEDFLASYDNELRKRVGVYYTPIDVVRFQVRAIDGLLRQDLHTTGYGDETVAILDPATGTGTYLIGIFEYLADHVRQEAGAAAVRGALRALANRSYGFEILVGPYAVARWRLTTFLREEAIDVAPRVVLTDTVSEPRGGRHVSGRFGFIDRPLTEERTEAERVKTRQPIQVILGNPPYERTNLRADDSADDETGGRWSWIWALVADFMGGMTGPARRDAARTLADRYVLFYRWAFWKLLSTDVSDAGRGIVSFISNRSFLIGGDFAGMRSFIRNHFQRVIVVDLGGDVRAARLTGGGQDEPVFDILTGTAISICLRTSEEGECVVEYVRLRGTREEKFAALRNLNVGTGFEQVPGTEGDSFVPRGSDEFYAWPSLPDLFSERFSGVETKRDDIVVAVRSEDLARRIDALRQMAHEDAGRMFHATGANPLPSRSQLEFDPEYVVEYGYRPLDRRRLYSDPKFIDRPRPTLRAAWGDSNVALVTLPRKHGSGPAAFVHSYLPDRHSYRGSYGGHVFPLWDNRNTRGRARGHNFRPAFMDAVRAAYGDIKPETVFDYIYAVLLAPSYTRRFHEELQQSFPRVPFPRDRRLFEHQAERGEQILSVHCFERRARRGENPSKLEGADSVVSAIDYEADRRRVSLGNRVYITEVTPEIWSFEVSGYPVVRRWLEARIGLTLTADEVKELRDVLFAVRKTVEMSRMLDEALEKIITRPQLDLSALLTEEGDDERE